MARVSGDVDEVVDWCDGGSGVGSSRAVERAVSPPPFPLSAVLLTFNGRCRLRRWFWITTRLTVDANPSHRQHHRPIPCASVPSSCG